MLQKFLAEDHARRDRVEEAIRLFSRNPHDTRLHVHQLKRRLRGKWFLHLNGDEIIVFEWVGERRTRFLAIGDHSTAYGRPKKRKTS